MATDTNTISKRANKSPNHKIKKVKIFDLVPEGDNVSVILTSTRKVGKSSSMAEIEKRAKQSPWKQDEFIRKIPRRGTNKLNPSEEISRFNTIFNRD